MSSEGFTVSGISVPKSRFEVSVQVPKVPEIVATPPHQPVATSQPNTLGVPAKQPYIISESNKAFLEAVDSMSAAGRNTNILVTGKQGIGKSELVVQYAATRNRPLATLEIGNLAEASQIFGRMDLKDGATTYVPGLFTEAITTPNAVVHLQEINRPENDKALNAIFSVLDDTYRAIWIDELQKTLKVAPGVTFFASLNEGFEFIGTLPLDEALRNRFQIKLDLTPLPRAQERIVLLMKAQLTEEQVEILLDLADRLRGNTQEPIYLSTRDLVNIALLMQHGLSPTMAVKGVVGTGMDKLESVLLSEHLAGRGFIQEEEKYGIL